MKNLTVFLVAASFFMVLLTGPALKAQSAETAPKTKAATEVSATGDHKSEVGTKHSCEGHKAAACCKSAGGGTGHPACNGAGKKNCTANAKKCDHAEKTKGSSMKKSKTL